MKIYFGRKIKNYDPSAYLTVEICHCGIFFDILFDCLKDFTFDLPLSSLGNEPANYSKTKFSNLKSLVVQNFN